MELISLAFKNLISQNDRSIYRFIELSICRDDYDYSCLIHVNVIKYVSLVHKHIYNGLI